MSIFGDKGLAAGRKISKARTWNDIYEFTENDESFSTALKNVRDICAALKNEHKELFLYVQSIWDENGTSYEKLADCIDKCVDYSIQNENNALFGFIYMEYLMHYNDKVYNAFVDSVVSDEDKKILKAVHFMKPKNWNNPENIYDIGNASLFYNSTEIFVVSSMDSKYPTKELIVQYGLVLGLNSKTINMWLKLAGRDMLYPLDIADSVSRFYLDYFSRKNMMSEDNEPDRRLSQDEAESRLKMVKSQICKYQKLMLQDSKEDENKFSIKLKQLEDGIYLGGKDDISRYDWKRKEWSYYKLLEGIREKYLDSGFMGNSPTVFINNKLLQSGALLSEEEFDKLIKKNISLFRQVHYSLTEKNIEYLSNTEKKVKNLLYYAAEYNENYRGNELSAQSSAYYQMVGIQKNYEDSLERGAASKKKKRKNEKTEAEQDSKAQKELEELIIKNVNMNYEIYKYLREPNKKLTTFLNIANYTMVSPNMLEKEWVIYRSYKGNASNAIRFKILGREKKSNNEKGVYQEKFSMTDAVKYCIGTGNEDDLSEYMRLSGYWDFDVTDMDEWENDEREMNRLTPTDLYIVYLFRLRDKIMENWFASCREKDQKTWMDSTRKRFPVVILSALVTRDIQLICRRVSGDYYREMVERFTPCCTEQSDLKWFDDLDWMVRKDED